MLVQFQIIYKTHLGQEMVLVGSIPELGENVLEKAQKMTLLDPISGLWAYSAELGAISDFSYRYFVKDDNFNTFIDEWGADRFFDRANK
ncbi:MAG: carbohydrate-binding module family 20 domain-containing protein, partial [Bacteroidales bacterium]